MVAITVILAAVIGAFVLEIGDQQETAPNTSFDSEQRDRTFFGGGQARLNFTKLSVAHAGGDVVDRESLSTKVDGNASVYDNQDIGNDDVGNTLVPSAQTFTGSNQLVTKQDTGLYPYGDELTSGQSIGVFSYGTVSYEALYGCLYANKGSIDRINVEAWENGNVDFESVAFDGRPGGNMNTCDGNSKGGSKWGPMNLLSTGDQVDVVWTASSGGKTQTLFKYTVQ
jgi:FlaG/FlaF family flagellin (archaellin)